MFPFVSIMPSFHRESVTLHMHIEVNDWFVHESWISTNWALGYGRRYLNWHSIKDIDSNQVKIDERYIFFCYHSICWLIKLKCNWKGAFSACSWAKCTWNSSGCLCATALYAAFRFLFGNNPNTCTTNKLQNKSCTVQMNECDDEQHDHDISLRLLCVFICVAFGSNETVDQVKKI